METFSIIIKARRRRRTRIIRMETRLIIITRNITTTPMLMTLPICLRIRIANIIAKLCWFVPHWLRSPPRAELYGSLEHPTRMNWEKNQLPRLIRPYCVWIFSIISSALFSFFLLFLFVLLICTMNLPNTLSTTKWQNERGDFCNTDTVLRERNNKKRRAKLTHAQYSSMTSSCAGGKTLRGMWRRGANVNYIPRSFRAENVFEKFVKFWKHFFCFLFCFVFEWTLSPQRKGSPAQQSTWKKNKKKKERKKKTEKEKEPNRMKEKKERKKEIKGFWLKRKLECLWADIDWVSVMQKREREEERERPNVCVSVDR